MKKEITYLSQDGITTIHAYIWEPADEIKAIVQISHGMIDHMARYEEFASTLTAQGYLVCGNDHLGHGQSVVDSDHLGYFAKKNSTQILIDDVYALTKQIKELYPNKPIFLFGHSMGSFITRNYINNYSNDIAGMIITGSEDQPKIILHLAKLVTKITQFYHYGWFYRSPFLNNLTIGKYHKYFGPNAHYLAWLCKDKELLAQIEQDPLSNFQFTCNGYYTLFDLMLKMNKRKKIKQIRQNLPIFILSGKDDPVSHFGQDVYKIAKRYKKRHLNNVSINIYNNLRHEIINDSDKFIVLNDILTFLEQNIAK